MRVALWLASRELAARPGRVALAAGAVAAATALAVGLELVARLRQGAVAERIDRAGPPLRVVPAGVSATALARYDLGGRLLPAGAAEAVRRAVPGLRALEARLVLEAPVAGEAAPLVGVPGAGAAWDGALAALRPGEVALGAVLAAKSGARVGEGIPVGRARFRVAAVLPAAASAEDLVAYVPLAALQDLAWLPGAVNEIRLFLRPGFRPDEAARALVAPPGAALVRTGRGEVAEREAPQALDRLRGLGSAVAGVVAALALLLGAHLDAAERRGELAALVALGGTGATVLASVLARSSLTAAAGAAAGAIAGTAAAWFQDPARAWALGDALPAVAVALAAAVALGAVAALPAAARAAQRDPVADLE